MRPRFKATNKHCQTDRHRDECSHRSRPDSSVPKAKTDDCADAGSDRAEQHTAHRPDCKVGGQTSWLVATR